MSINKTLMAGLLEKDMDAVIRSYDLKPFYFPTLYPLKENLTLNWKSLEAIAGLKVAGDIVSRGSTISRKKRESIGKVGGLIPKIAFAREMDENDLTEYETALALAGGNPNLAAIVRFWGEDMQACWDGVASRIEWIALRQLSTGKVKLTQTDNQNVVTEFDVDYKIPSAQRTGVTKKWSEAGAEPISELETKIQAARKGKNAISSKIAFMNMSTFGTFARNEQVIKMSASFAQNALNISQTPDLATINAMLMKQPWLNGLQIKVIDQDITVEVNGERSTSNPFADDVVSLVESPVLGTTFWKKPIDANLQGSSAIKSMNGPILIKKFSTEEPITEVTQGIANAFPAWNGANRSILLDTESTNGFTK